MKQHISGSQYAELSESGRDRLDTWLDETHRHVLNDRLLNIGEMIEFLNIKFGNPFDGGFIDYREHQNEWMVCSSTYYYAAELCDALWLAVRDVLEQKL